MNVIVVDDEKPARDRLIRMLDPIHNLTVVDQAADGQQALHMILEKKPDAVFVDISMPIMNGMQLAHHLHKELPDLHIIFTTAHDEYGVEAFEVNAHDYLLKPIRKERLQAAISKLQLSDTPSNNQFLTLKDREQIIKVSIADVICLHADQKYTEVHVADKQWLSAESLKELENRFEQHFLRIHRSTLINKSFLLGVEQQPQGLVALLKDSKLKPEVSRRHHADIKRFLQQ